MNEDDPLLQAKAGESKAAAPPPDAKAPVASPKADTPGGKAPMGEPGPEAKAPAAKASTPGIEAAAAGPAPNAKAAEAKPGAGSGHRFDVRNKILFALSIAGVLAGLVAAYIFGMERKSQPPVFKPVSSPYDSAIFANGIVESDQANGSNININPEVSGPITQVFVHEGQTVSAGAPLLTIDDSVQRANTEQLRLQAEASLALLNELKAQPRGETLAIAGAQVALADSSLKVARDQYEKRLASFNIDPKSISKDVLDSAEDAVTQAAAGLDVARKQYDLTKAGAWSYDIASQEKQYSALSQAYNAANALLLKYSIRAPSDGIVLTVGATVGSYVSAQGAYDTYTEGLDPLMVMGAPQDTMAVRCYVDEILVSRLPSKWHIVAQMSIIGTDIKVPLEFVRVQPYVSPKIELSNERQEKVDLRVLPLIFRFQKKDFPVYPGQLVDVYIGNQ